MDVLQDSELFQAQSHLYKHIFNYISSMSMKCAVELGIPDIIHNHGQPITLPDLVSALEIHPSKTSFVHRLMCLLVHSGFFSETRLAVKHHTNQQDGDQEEEEEAYDLTPSSRLLLKSKLPCMLPFVLSMLDPAMVTPWHFLGDWFRGNRGSSSTPFEIAHNMSIWEYGNQNPEFGNLFNEAMASDSGIMNLVIRDYKPVFEGLVTLVDVGGGTGQLGRIITESIPHLKCTVLDLPHVVANSPVVETENLKFIGGDMFQSIPPADAVMLKWILHSWSDEKCLEILKKCRGAIPSDRGKVIIIDMVINRDKEEHQLTEVKLFFDMLMMAMTTGRERSEKDWEKLFLEAGFMSYKTTPIFGLRSLIEVFP